MSTTPREPEKSPQNGQGDVESAEPAGVEVGFADGEGTTFEPEEDPGSAGEE